MPRHTLALFLCLAALPCHMICLLAHWCMDGHLAHGQHGTAASPDETAAAQAALSALLYDVPGGALSVRGDAGSRKYTG